MNELYQMVSTEQSMLNIRELAQLLRISERSAHRLAIQGCVPGRKILGRWRFPKQEILIWISGKDVR